MQDTWPEDEAACTHATYCDLRDSDGVEYAQQWLTKQVDHMHKVFDDMIDIDRYDTHLKQLVAGD